MSARISRIGMVTAVGHDAVTACAAVRAGIIRRSPLEGVVAYDADDEEMEMPVVGAPVSPLTDGFIHTGAWVQLAYRAMEDLASFPPEVTDPVDFWRETALLWVLPPIAVERFGWEPEMSPGLLDESCSELLQELLGVTFASAPDPFILAGHTGVAQAVERAERMLRERAARRVAILGTDSWLDQLSISALSRESRLQTSESPTGMTPAEGGAAVVLEQDKDRDRDRDGGDGGPDARILSVSIQPAPGPLDEEDPAAWRTAMAPKIGRALAAAIDEVLPRAQEGRQFTGDAILDLNGEEWRSLAWGHAKVHLAQRLEPNEVIPASSYGDIGAASGAAALCLAARSYARGYSAGDQTLICSLSDDGQVAAMLVGKG